MAYCQSSAFSQKRLRISSPPSLRQEQQGECFISRIPDEILLEIFSYVPSRDSVWGSRRCRSIFTTNNEPFPPFPVMLVCKLWRRIYEAVLFRNIYFRCYCNKNIDLKARKLLHLLDERPHLRNYPHSLEIQWITDDLPADVAKIVQHCNAIRKVNIFKELTNDDWPLLRAIKSRCLLQSLTLSHPSLSLIFEHLNLPSLKHLSITGYGFEEKKGEPSISKKSDVIPVSQQQLDRFLPPSCYRRGNLTSIEFSSPNTPDYVTAHILRLPRSLEAVSFIGLNESIEDPYYGVSSIQGLIDIHQHSLKHIKLGIVSEFEDSLCMPNFKHFPYLEELHMSAYDLMRGTPSYALERLAAPRLHSLTATFCTQDFGSGLASDFGPDQYTWVKEFATLRSHDYPKSNLSKISLLDFDPQYQIQDLVQQSKPKAPWPWEHIELASQAVAKLGPGLVILYDGPRWTREEWDKGISLPRD